MRPIKNRTGSSPNVPSHQQLSARTDSDEPQFVKGLSTELRGLLDRKVMNWIMRFKLGAALALGHGPAGMRSDPAGIIIELLPPRLRDHMPDRYIGSLTFTNPPTH